MENKKQTRADVSDIVQDAMIDFYTDSAKGEHGDGLWHYLRVGIREEELIAWAGCKASKCYGEDEYYDREMCDRTIATEQGYYSPDASTGGLNWSFKKDYTQAEWDDKFAHKAYYYGLCGASDYCSKDQYEENPEEYPGYEEFALGEPAETPELPDNFDEIINSLCAHFGITE